MEQPDAQPSPELESPLEVFTVDDDSPLIFLHWRLLVADGTEEDNENQAPIFRTRVTFEGRACNAIIDGGSAMKAVDKLQLPTIKHPRPYRVEWVDDYLIIVNRQCIVPLKMGLYEDVIPMNVARIILGRPWLKRLKVITEHADNTYTFKWNGRRIQLKPMETPFYAKQATPIAFPHILTMCKLEVESKEQGVIYALVTKQLTNSNEDSTRGTTIAQLIF